METIERWHAVVRDGDLDALGDLLHEDAVFHSPVVHSPVEGRPMVTMYLAGAFQVLKADAEGDFTYVREIVGERDALLEFVTVVEGITINGVDIIRWDDDGRITDFKVMIRPKKAFDLVHRKMAEMLAAAAGGG